MWANDIQTQEGESSDNTQGEDNSEIPTNSVQGETIQSNIGKWKSHKEFGEMV